MTSPRLLRALASLLALTPALAAIAFPASAGAASFYACDCADGADQQCQPGDDGADGTSPQTAWRTYDRAQDAFGALDAGDQLNFCRGGVFPISGSTRWNNSQCTAAQNCTVTAYTAPWANGDEPRPQITQVDGHAFEFVDGGDPDHEEGYRFSDLDLRCTACSGAAYAFVLYNDVDDVRLERLRITGFSIGVHLAGSNSCAGIPTCDDRNARLSLVASEIIDNHGMGFLGAGDELLIADNLFSGNGRANVFDHNVYISESGGQTTGIRVLRNELYRSSVGDGDVCYGVSLVVHGYHTDLLIEDNLVYEDLGRATQGCWGIGLTAGGTPEAEGFVRAIVRGNTIRNVGNSAIALSSCVDCIVENNRIEHEQPFQVWGVQATDFGRDAGDLTMTRLIVRNNSIYSTAGESVGVRIADEGDGHVIVSNAMQSTGPNSACLDLPLATTAYPTVDHNVCSSGPGSEWEKGSGDLQTWRAATGFDVASLATLPGFADAGAPAHDLTAASAASPMVDAGHPTLSAATEFRGKPRVGSPDAGAHEHGVTPSIFADGFETPGQRK